MRKSSVTIICPICNEPFKVTPSMEPEDSWLTKNQRLRPTF